MIDTIKKIALAQKERDKQMAQVLKQITKEEAEKIAPILKLIAKQNDEFWKEFKTVFEKPEKPDLFNGNKEKE